MAALRSTRPAAATALPSLAPAPAPANGAGGNHRQVLAVPTSAPVVAIHHNEASRPVLPPRPTGQMHSAEPRSIWQNWPLIVIVLALLAIGTAVTLMVWPSSSKKAESSHLAPPPAPERMDTNPLPPPGTGQPQQQPGADPWNNSGGSGPTGRIDPPTDPGADPDDNVDLNDLKDPFASPRGGGRKPRLNTTGFGFTIMKHACNRMSKCGNADPILKSTCNALDTVVPSSPTPNCAAAQRCLDHVDQLDCNTSLNATDMGILMMSLKDCEDALLRC